MAWTATAALAVLWLGAFAIVLLAMAAREVVRGPLVVAVPFAGRCLPLSLIWPALLALSAPIALAAWIWLLGLDRRLTERRWLWRLVVLVVATPAALYCWSGVYGYNDDVLNGVIVDSERLHRTWGFWWSLVKSFWWQTCWFCPELVIGTFGPYLWLTERVARWLGREFDPRRERCVA